MISSRLNSFPKNKVLNFITSKNFFVGNRIVLGRGLITFNLKKLTYFNFSYKNKNINHQKMLNLSKDKPTNPLIKKDDTDSLKKNPFQGQKLNISYENIKNILINLSKDNNYNYNNLPKDDISHEEFFEVNKMDSVENKIIKHDTSKIYNETIITYIIENLPNIKEKETLSLSNLTNLIEIINEKQIGNLEIFEKLVTYAENKLIEVVKTNIHNNKNIISKKEKDVIANDILAFFKIHSELGKANLDILNIFLEIYIGNLNLNQIQLNSQLEKERLNSFMNELFNVLWLVSISIANICENSNKIINQNNNSLNNTNTNLFNKATNNPLYSSPNKSLYLETYDKNLERDLLLSEKAVINLVNLLKFISKNLDFENMFDLEMDQKIRLYKSLLYFKLEGIVLNENLDNFVKKFKNFHLLNVQNMITGSLMEKKFEELLKKFKVNFEKEKKTDFCSADFFIRPNIIIEINGPDHYSFGVLKGKDNMKKRVLKFLGFKILNVSFREFNNLNELEIKIRNILKIDLKKIIPNK